MAHPDRYVEWRDFTSSQAPDSREYSTNANPIAFHFRSCLYNMAFALSYAGSTREPAGDKVRQPVDVPRVAPADVPLSALPVGAFIAMECSSPTCAGTGRSALVAREERVD